MRDAGIPCALIPDTSIGYTIEKVDFVIVGAEGVVRNGGIINQIGTYPLAVVAKQANKPFYCISERFFLLTSYKFVNVFPLNQDDLNLPCEFSFSDANDLRQAIPNCDYTPPGFVTMFFTNEGVLTPSGVSELFLRSAKN